MASNFLRIPTQTEEIERARTPPPPYDEDDRVAPYGTWESAFTFESINGPEGSTTLDTEGQYNPLLCDTEKGTLYLTAGRQNGTCTILSYDIQSESVKNLLDDDVDVRSRVHEYGGAAMSLLADGRIIFVDRAKGDSVWLLDPATKTTKLLSQAANKRYADFGAHPSNKFAVAIEEDHGDGNIAPKDVINRLVCISLENGMTTTICEGADFYTSPRFSREGNRVCWVQWNHPDMPWTGSELHVADWTVDENGKPLVANVEGISGEAGKVSVSQPRWIDNGDLLFVNDATGWTQLNRLDTNGELRRITLKGLEEVDFANVDFGLGNHIYFQLSDDRILASYYKEARNHLIIIELSSQTHRELEIPLVAIWVTARISNTELVLKGAGDAEATGTYIVDISTPAPRITKVQWVDDADQPRFEKSLFSVSRPISFPRQIGEPIPSETPTHALFQPPHNPRFRAPEGSKPPLIVYCHGGPTSIVMRGLSLQWQYWTSRGFAVAHVNYHGSSNYGRTYRASLDSHYGILDVDDAASCALYLAKTGLIDGSRVGIVGGSSGGYCVLQALTRFPEIWAGGVSLFGIAKLEDLMADTHKFESRYLDKLVFKDGMDEKEQRELLKERSPYYHAKNVKAPCLLLQGLEDRVVPPDQAREMEKAIKGNGGDVRLVLYEGEGHGFVKRENRKNALEEEEKWWMRTLVRQSKADN